MGKGSKHISLRLKPEVWQKLDAALSQANRHATRKSPAEPYTLRSWIAAAIDRELAHLERARRHSRKRAKRRRSAEAVERPAQESVQNANVGPHFADSDLEYASPISEELVASDGVAQCESNHEEADTSAAADGEQTLAWEPDRQAVG